MSHQTRSRKAPTDRHTRPSREIGGSSSCKCLRHRFVYWSPLWTTCERRESTHQRPPRKQAKTEHSGLARTLTTDTRTGSRVRFQALGCRHPASLFLMSAAAMVCSSSAASGDGNTVQAEPIIPAISEVNCWYVLKYVPSSAQRHSDVLRTFQRPTNVLRTSKGHWCLPGWPCLTAFYISRKS